MTLDLVARLEADKLALATETTEQMEQRHPDLFARYGDKGRTRCAEDTAFHVEHLAAALDVGEDGAFRDYVGWLVGLLEARNVPAGDVILNLDCLASVIESRYGSDASDAVSLLRDATPRASA